MDKPFELLSQITAQPADKRMGSTIALALQATFGNRASDSDYTAAGIICTLFLSAILEGFPTIKLHTYVRNYREESSLFTFDCKSYDTIIANISNYNLLLIDKNIKYTEKKVSKQEILESLDFFTNQ